MLTDFPRILKDFGNEFESMFGLISKFVLAEFRFTDRPRRVREASKRKEFLDGPGARRAAFVDTGVKLRAKG